MKAYTRHYGIEHYKFTYPEDMEILIKYLEDNGTLNITYKRLEELYFEFSEERYCAQWMDVDNDMLDLFSEWLENYEIGGN